MCNHKMIKKLVDIQRLFDHFLVCTERSFLYAFDKHYQLQILVAFFKERNEFSFEIVTIYKIFSEKSRSIPNAVTDFTQTHCFISVTVYFKFLIFSVI